MRSSSGCGGKNGRATAMSQAVTDLLDCVWRPDSRHVWAENFDRTIDAHFRTQAAVLRAIVSFLSPQIKRAEPDRVRITALNDLTAHELAQQSWTAILSEEMSYESGPRDRAATHAQQILTRDSRSGLVHIAHWLGSRGGQFIVARPDRKPGSAGRRHRHCCRRGCAHPTASQCATLMSVKAITKGRTLLQGWSHR